MLELELQNNITYKKYSDMCFVIKPYYQGIYQEMHSLFVKRII